MKEIEVSAVQQVRMFFKGGRALPAMHTRKGSGRAQALTLVALLFASLFLPTVSAAIGISMSANPMAQTVDPGENGTYTITVQNTGDEDMTVSLSTAQTGQDCSGYTSTIEQITDVISAGASEQTDLTVTLGSNAEGSCDTEVTGTAQVAPGGTPGSPEQDTVTVTTTAGSGSGGTVTGVALSSSNTNREFNGNNPVSWAVTVENTGQTTETIQLSFEDNASCQSNLNPSVDPSTVELNSSESEVVTVEVTVPEGTEAGDHCFTLKAVVTAPQTPEEASDTIRLYLDVPEMHECIASVSPSSMQVDPGETKSATVTYSNTGNADWTVGFSASGSKNWLSAQGGSTRLLPYDGGNGQVTITFDISPDDSIAADSTVQYTIGGLDGSNTACTADFSVVLGQSHDASINLQSSRIDNIEPGTTRSVILSVANLGNGAETVTLWHSAPPEGWMLSFSQRDITLSGRHDGAGSSADVQLDVTAPSDALATDELTFTISVRDSVDFTYDSDDLTVTVAAHRSMDASMTSLEQWGKTGETAKFPISITNTGNIQDQFRLTICDDPPSSNPSACDTPKWTSRFSDTTGSQITQITLNPGASVTVYLDITVEGEDEFESEAFQARVKNVNDGSVEQRFDVVVITSNHLYKMSITLNEPGEIPDLQEIFLPPEGEAEFNVTITNIGTSNFLEEAILSVSGMESSVKVTVFVNGSEASGPIEVKPSESVQVRITLEVLEGVPNGQSGMIILSAASTRNAAEPTSVRVSLTIRTDHEVNFEVSGDAERTITYGEFSRILVNITNDGNVDEVIVLTSSDPMRGWSVEITDEEIELGPQEYVQVEVIIKPPTDLDMADTFQVTLTATPESSPAAAQPIDVWVTAEPASGLLGSGSVLQTIGVTLVGVLFLMAIVSMFKNRSED